MKKKTLIWILAAVATVIAAAACLLFVFRDRIFRVTAAQTYTFINPDPTRAETDAGMTVDGVFDEAVYAENTWYYLHNANGGNTVDLAITSYFGEKGIYFAYEVRENTPIYVNMARPSWMNSCIEMYLVPSNVEKMPSENVFEIDLLPTGYLLFKRPNAAGGWSDVSTTHDKMAYLGAKPYGGAVNTDACTGYDLELFIPYDYLELLGVDTQLIKDGYVNVNPSHITSYNESGTDGSVDRFWYSFGKQLGGDGWNDINRYFKFNQKGAMGTVPNEFAQAENCTLTGKPNAIAGLPTTVTVTPEEGYALTSVVCNGEELIQYVNYQEDGSVKLTLPAANSGMVFEAKAEPVTQGNKTVTGRVELKNIFGDTLSGVSASYEDASGEHKLEINDDGSFSLTDAEPGYYIIRVKKDGYQRAERTLQVSRDMDIAVELSYDLFATESGNCWNVTKANDGVLTKINGTGSILTKDQFDDFYAEVTLRYSHTLAAEFSGDDYQQQRMGIRVKFDNKKYWHIDLLRQDDGKYHLQFGKILGEDSLFDWDLVHELTAAEIDRYTGEAGIKLGVLRTGRTAYIYLDNALVGTADLGKDQADCKAQIGLEAFVSNAEVMTVPFAMEIHDPSRVIVEDSGSVGATAALNREFHLGKDAVIVIRKDTQQEGAKLLSVQVNGREMVQNTVSTASGYQLTVRNNQEKILSVKVIYDKPAKKTVKIDMMDTAADGVSVRLVQGGTVCASTVVKNGKAVFEDVYQGAYTVQARIFRVWTEVDSITVWQEEQLQADIKTLFETPEHTNYTGNVNFAGIKPEHYSVSASISGDAWFAMTLQLDKAKLESTAANKGNIRLGFRMFFGGYSGNYEWDNEYEITLKYTSEGNWILEQMNTWQSYALPAQAVSALTGDGLHFALYRDSRTGVLTLYYGATESELLSGVYACKWENPKHKQTVMRFGVGFWSENGSNYQAKVSDLRYASSLSQLFDIQQAQISLQVSGRKAGGVSLLPEGTQVLIQNAMGEHLLTVDADGRISGKLLPGSYQVLAEGYAAAKLEVPKSGVAGELTLFYDLFSIPTGWDTEKHDLSKVNDSTPVIAMSGGTMNVLTNDRFGNVSATLWVKEQNSTHSAHTQGIWVRFEDGKYMILYQEDEKLLYMQKLWDLETVLNTGITVCNALPEEIVQAWKTEGYQLGLIRKENKIYVTVAGALYHLQTLPEEYGDDLVQIGFFAYDSAAGASWSFDIQWELPVYEIVCKESENGTVLADKTSAQLCEAVELTVIPEPEYILKSLKVNGVERITDVTDGILAVTVVRDTTVEAVFETAKTQILSNTAVEDGTAIRLLQGEHVAAEGVFCGNRAEFRNIPDGKYQAQICVFGCWAALGEVEMQSGSSVKADVAALFENSEFTDFDGDLTFSGTAGKHCSVASDIAGDAWFAMKLQVDQDQLNAVAANRGNIRLGFRMFFGGEPGNYLWANEYELTFKCNSDGRWILEQMQSWEGWDNYLSQDAVDALTGGGLYIALYRDSKTGVLTLYYGATQEELMTLSRSFTYAQASDKQKENITRFGAGFWSENGSDYQATVTGLQYGTTLAEALS